MEYVVEHGKVHIFDGGKMRTYLPGTTINMNPRNAEKALLNKARPKLVIDAEKAANAAAAAARREAEEEAKKAFVEVTHEDVATGDFERQSEKRKAGK